LTVQIIAKRTLREFWLVHSLAEGSCKLWHARVSRAAWTGPADVKREFGTLVDFVANSRVMFDLGGNKFRLVAKIDYRVGLVLIRFIGTQKDYDRIDPATV
jgi:mRNA interferase HigB